MNRFGVGLTLTRKEYVEQSPLGLMLTVVNQTNTETVLKFGGATTNFKIFSEQGVELGSYDGAQATEIVVAARAVYTFDEMIEVAPSASGSNVVSIEARLLSQSLPFSASITVPTK